MSVSVLAKKSLIAHKHTLSATTTTTTTHSSVEWKTIPGVRAHSAPSGSWLAYRVRQLPRQMIRWSSAILPLAILFFDEIRSCSHSSLLIQPTWSLIEANWQKNIWLISVDLRLSLIDEPSISGGVRLDQLVRDLQSMREQTSLPKQPIQSNEAGRGKTRQGKAKYNNPFRAYYRPWTKQMRLDSWRHFVSW